MSDEVAIYVDKDNPTIFICPYCSGVDGAEVQHTTDMHSFIKGKKAWMCPVHKHFTWDGHEFTVHHKDGSKRKTVTKVVA